MKLKLSWQFPLIVLLAGCASTPPPAAKVYRGPVTRVHDTATAVSSSETYFFRLAEVNDHAVQQNSGNNANPESAAGMARSRVTSSHFVPAQPCLLTIEGIDHDTTDVLGRIFGMPRVLGYVEVNLESGKEYFVRGDFSGNPIAVWVEDGAGNRVSNVIHDHLLPLSELRPMADYPTSNYN